MVKIILFLLILIGIGISISLFSTTQTSIVTQKTADFLPIEMQVGIFEDSHCGVVIHDLTDAAQVIFPDQAVFFFHDHGGMAEWLHKQQNKHQALIWVHTRDTLRLIKAQDAFFSTDDSTIMGSGYGAYEHNAPGRIRFDELLERIATKPTARKMSHRHHSKETQ
ncbi:MAG: hypothetical protein K2O85_01425 [Helicobacter sp.]|nr:hypothetical protein [Helicobacter sp.]